MSNQVAVKNLTGIARELVQRDREMGIAGADGSVEHEILATVHEVECLDLRPQSAGMRRAGSSECRNAITTKGGSWRTSSMASPAKGRPTCRPPAAQISETGLIGHELHPGGPHGWSVQTHGKGVAQR